MPSVLLYNDGQFFHGESVLRQMAGALAARGFKVIAVSIQAASYKIPFIDERLNDDNFQCLGKDVVQKILKDIDGVLYPDPRKYNTEQCQEICWNILSSVVGNARKVVKWPIDFLMVMNADVIAHYGLG